MGAGIWTAWDLPRFPRTLLSPETHGRKADIPWGPVAARSSGSNSSLQQMPRLSLRRTPNHPSAALPQPWARSGPEPGDAGAEPSSARGTREGPAARSPRPGLPPPPAAAAPELPQRPRSPASSGADPRGDERSGAELPPRPDPSPSARVLPVPLPVSPRCPRQAPVSPRYRCSCPRGAAPARCRSRAVPCPRGPAARVPSRYRSGPARCRSFRTRGCSATPRSAPPGPAQRRPDITAGQWRPRPPRGAAFSLVQRAWRHVWPRPRRGESTRRGEATPLWRRGGGA